MVLERCCTSFEQALEAVENGAGRIELCLELNTGGLTPPPELVRRCSALPIPVNVLVRPRAGDFVFTEEETEILVRDIQMCRREGAAGVVIGALTPEGDVDMTVMKRLMSVAKDDAGQRDWIEQNKSGEKDDKAGDKNDERVRGGLSVTFHRAFDVCRNPFEALEDIIALGCDRILTSGQKDTALEGAELIAALVGKAGDRIIIMPGSGVTPANLDSLQRLTGAGEFHGTRLCAK